MILSNLEAKESNSHSSHKREKGKLSFLFTSQQFSKFVEEQFPECLSLKHTHMDKNYFDKIEDSTHTLYFSRLLNYVLSTNGRYKKQFQRFLQNKCTSLLNIPVIDLDNLSDKCNTKESQIILLLSMVYYFS